MSSVWLRYGWREAYNTAMSSLKNMATVASRTLVLASGSPRRRELMGKYFNHVELNRPSDEEPEPEAGEKPDAYALRVAQIKAKQIAQRRHDAVVIAADTVVALDGHIMGKPEDAGEAVRMLELLRGKTHRVTTGVVVLDTGTGLSYEAAPQTAVTMRGYSDGEIADYVASGEPMDKAGGYAIQDVTFKPVSNIEGCYLNVVGLPVWVLAGLLAQAGKANEMKVDVAAPTECTDCTLGKAAR